MVIDNLLAYTAVAFVVEALVEYFIAKWAGDYAKYVAAVVGVLLAIGFQLDIFEAFLGLKSTIPYLGCAVTGFVLGRGANFVNDFADKYLRAGI